MISKKVLVGKKIILRTVSESDCNNAYISWMNDYETNYYMETRWNEQTLETIIDFVNSVAKSQDSYLVAIIDQSSSTHIGNIKLGPINQKYKYAEISYFIGDKKFRGMGYAQEAVELVCEYGFTVLQLHRIQAGVIDGNTRSEKVLVANGFLLEGRLRHKFIRDGVYLDHLIYGRLNR